MVESPVLFLVFNRPSQTARVAAAIRAAGPRKLYIAADGPRKGRPADDWLCAEARRIAMDEDWPCEVATLLRDQNLGCKQAVSSAISWFFEHEERGIILEDDCLPHADFFAFCDELLARYADDDRVSVVTGNNFQRGRKRGQGSYYFSKYNHCWGWASWRRAWKHYDGDLKFWHRWMSTQAWRDKVPDRVERRYWKAIFDSVVRREIDSWAYPWTASVWYRGGLTATPNVNLVTNIGFGLDATHTRKASGLYVVPTAPIVPLIHTDDVAQDVEADRYAFYSHFLGRRKRFPYVLYYAPRALAGRAVRRLLDRS